MLETIHRVNFDGGEPPKYVWRDKKEINLETVNVIRESARMVPVSKDYVYKTLGIPEPQKGEELLEIKDDGQGIASAPKQDFSSDKQGADIPNFDEFDQATDTEIKKIFEFAKHANDLDELKQNILDEFPNISNSALAEVAAKALELEVLEGMNEANQQEI
ncbi:hypothetical protein [Pseudoalteromonas obscura]|uniref:Uncharacterized protein n=1 Tax=Pseudoalteromonas obscura TaxID=3048491 RepID=A0ABT7EFY7_9GAMM|nr:hypothetical protein [Pseudoalteromonas sp. P94(2023)]MDK2593522.1 hypothetical protein [Pseudoalteromonas sp. P94(2023)]